MEQSHEIVAEKLISIKSFKMQPSHPFVWGNGWKSPIYFDSRKMLSYPIVREFISQELVQVVRNHYPEAECIAAVATNSIALGVMVAQQLNLPFAYVYPHPKDHGLENRIEGDLKPRQKVVIIEDQLSEGKNCALVQEALKQDGCQVLGMVAVLDFGLKQGQASLTKAQLKCHALLTLEQAVSYALDHQIITPVQAETARTWMASPESWRK